MVIKGMISVSVLVAALMAAGCCTAFQVPFTALTSSIGRRQHRTVVAAGDKEKEIAELEELLSQLKADPSQTESEVETASNAAVEKDEDFVLPPSMSEPDDAFDMNAYRKRVANVKEQPPAEFLTEAWKESVGDSPGLADNLKIAAIIVAALVFLVAFSQVPIGDEDLSKYSSKIGL